MISDFTLKTLKLEVAPKNIVRLSLKGRDFVFRTLSKKEYDEILLISGGNEDEVECLVCEFTYLYPKDYNFRTGLAGLNKKASDLIIKHSLVSDVDGIKSLILEKRSQINTLERQCLVAIKSAMPEVTTDMFDNMSWQEIIDKVVIAEQILLVRHSSMTAAFQGMEFDFALKFADDIPCDEKVEPVPMTKEMRSREIQAQGMSMWERGLDPAMAFGLSDVNRVDTITPLVLTGGRYWNNQGVVDIIGEEIRSKGSRN